uniref:Uncharacterized protein n=1 Tax=Megaselia scalaris TaxID=36166 RepID=T1GBB2_MEGSC
MDENYMPHRITTFRALPLRAESGAPYFMFEAILLANGSYRSIPTSVTRRPVWLLVQRFPDVL